ncbi:MAG: response regulator [Cytophaga sp.]|nr:response regulator [Cytophaga sp.]
MRMTKSTSILLAEDDPDDCFIFQEALSEIPIATSLTIIHDGVELLHLLEYKESENWPSILFLDLNMPRLNGMECMEAISKNEKLQLLKVIILSTAFPPGVVDQLLQFGARQCIKKPGDFNTLVALINDALAITEENQEVIF